jgi:hypothetical protein
MRISSELDSSNLRINDLSCDIVISQDCKVHDCLAIASLIRRSKTQCWAGNTIELFKNLDLLTHFLSVTRHRRFEDVQAVVDLIGDARQISSLSSDLILYYSLLSRLCDLLCDLCTFQHPLTSSCTSIQREWTDTIRRCNEASTLTCKEVTLNALPINSQHFTHGLSLYARTCNSQGFPDSRNHRIATTRS